MTPASIQIAGTLCLMTLFSPGCDVEPAPTTSAARADEGFARDDFDRKRYVANCRQNDSIVYRMTLANDDTTMNVPFGRCFAIELPMGRSDGPTAWPPAWGSDEYDQWRPPQFNGQNPLMIAVGDYGQTVNFFYQAITSGQELQTFMPLSHKDSDAVAVRFGIHVQKEGGKGSRPLGEPWP